MGSTHEAQGLGREGVPRGTSNASQSEGRHSGWLFDDAGTCAPTKATKEARKAARRSSAATDLFDQYLELLTEQANQYFDSVLEEY